MKKNIDKINTENFRWGLSQFYSGIDDKNIDEDKEVFEKSVILFNNKYKGKLSEALGKALVDYSEIKMLENKLGVFLYLLHSTNLNDEKVKAKMAEMEIALSRIGGEYLTFFEIELAKLDEKIINKLYTDDKIVKKHRPWIEYVRFFRAHMLSEEVESALTKRSAFGTGAWSQFFDEFESGLDFTFKGKHKTLVEMLHMLSEFKNAKDREGVLSIIDSGIRGTFAKYSAQVLYMVTGSNAVENKERSYKNPMTFRNMANRIPDSVVDKLHIAVQKVAGPLAQKYYKLKAKHLGLKILKWSDRNAPMPFSDTTITPFDEALKIVLEAYESFSPTLANLIRESIKTKRIDAPAVKGKRSGAFNYSVVLPGKISTSFTFLNYLGSNRDIMTLAHELGHCVHGLLAGKEQGALMSHFLIAYAETASIFGEMTTYNFLKKKLYEKGDKKSLLALIMEKIDSNLNTTVRQIGFSNFERRIHGIDHTYSVWHEPKKLSVKEINDIWLETLRMLYGKDGDVFDYKDTEYLWTYVHHFHRPFYVYGYAFGELLTQSIHAKKKDLGDRFEPLYLDLLKSGMTKDVIDLLKPFNINPNDEDFWANGIKFGLGEMIEEAEKLSKGILK